MTEHDDSLERLLADVMLAVNLDESSYITGWVVEISDRDEAQGQLHGPYRLEQARELVQRVSAELDEADPQRYSFRIRALYDFGDV